MYVLRVTLMYLTPFAAGGFDYALAHRSLPFAAAVTVILLGVTVWRREKAAAMSSLPRMGERDGGRLTTLWGNGVMPSAMDAAVTARIPAIKAPVWQKGTPQSMQRDPWVRR